MRVFEVKPHDVDIDKSTFKNVHTIFLAGTIDNGKSENWQKEYIDNMNKIANDINEIRKDEPGFNPDDYVFIIYNPRRNSGDGFTSDNTNEMNYQVNWELDHLGECDFIYMRLLPDSKSPISLMELGLFANSGKINVICPKEFYRYDNVRIVCERYNIPLKNNVNDEWDK